MPELVMLIARETSEKVQQLTDKTRVILRKFKVAKDPMEIKEIDGTMEENLELRGKLFELSGQVAVYPQLFSLDEEGTYTFLASGHEIEGMNENQEVLVEMLKQDPEFLEKNTQYRMITDVFKDFIA